MPKVPEDWDPSAEKATAPSETTTTAPIPRIPTRAHRRLLATDTGQQLLRARRLKAGAELFVCGDGALEPFGRLRGCITQ